jgi:alpha-D-xyloside xylohydrolase
VYEGGDAHFTLYEDEGLNYNYEKGVFARISFDYKEDDKSLTIQKREGRFPGMLNERIFIIKYITRNRPGKLDLDLPAGIQVKYKGEKKIIALK